MSSEFGSSVEPRAAALREITIEAVKAMAKRDIGSLTEDTRLVSDLGFDSLRLIELSVVVEQRTGLPPLPLEESLTISTVGDVLKLVEKLAAGQSS